MPIHFGINFGVTECKKIKILPMAISCPALRCYIMKYGIVCVLPHNRTRLELCTQQGQRDRFQTVMIAMFEVIAIN